MTDGTVYDSGVWDLSGSRFEGGGMRYLRFRRFLQEALTDAERVVYEDNFYNLSQKQTPEAVLN